RCGDFKRDKNYQLFMSLVLAIQEKGMHYVCGRTDTSGLIEKKWEWFLVEYLAKAHPVFKRFEALKVKAFRIKWAGMLTDVHKRLGMGDGGTIDWHAAKYVTPYETLVLKLEQEVKDRVLGLPPAGGPLPPFGGVHEFAYPAAAPAADPAADPAAASAAPHARATHAHAAYARAAAAYPDDEDYPDLEFEGDTSGSSSGITNAAQYAPQVDESGIPPYPGIASDAAAAAARTLAGEALADAAGTQLETDNPTYEYFRRPGAPVNTAVVLPRDRSEALPLVQPRVARAKKADGPLEKLMKLNQEDPTLALEKLKLERMKLELEMRKVANEEAREARLVKYQEEQQVERRYDEQHHPARRLSPDGSNYSSFTSRSSKSSEPSTRETWQNQWEEYQQRGIQDLQQRMRREAEDRARRQTEEQQLNQRYWDSKDAEEREAKEERKTFAGLRGVVECDYGDGSDY
ncbi:hypothetical protein B484DRAFT_473124, partial [Ochromonadaceae sp. CCMP2298]